MPLTKKQKYTETSIIKELAKLLLDKYRNIIGNKHSEDTPIEEIVEHIVKYYESMIHCMPGNVYWFDKNCIGIGCNKNVLDMFGFKSLNEFTGLSFEEMGDIGDWPNDSTRSYKNDTLEVIKTRKSKTNIDELPLLHSDGRILY